MYGGERFEISSSELVTFFALAQPHLARSCEVCLEKEIHPCQHTTVLSILEASRQCHEKGKEETLQENYRNFWHFLFFCLNNYFKKGEIYGYF